MLKSLIAFLKEVKNELKNVDWPSREQAVRLTGVVIIVSVAVSLFVGGLDLVFTKLMENIIK